MYYIETLTTGPFGTNAYLLGPENSGRAVLIDAPPQCREAVAGALAASGRVLEAVIITHPHFDHTMDAVLFDAEGIPVYSHASAVKDVQSPDTLGLVAAPAGGFRGPASVKGIEPGGSMSIAGMELEMLDTPGHCPGSISIRIGKHCFVGDVLFRGSVGRTDLPGGDLAVLSSSIREQIYSLPDDTVVYPGHGPVTSVEREKHGNPYVRA